MRFLCSTNMEGNMILKKRIAAAPGLIQAAGIFLVILTFSLLLMSSDYAQATSAPTIISGVVQAVGTESITVNRNHYDISRAVLVTADGERTSISFIKPGDRVELAVDEGQVVRVRVDRSYSKELR